MEKRLRHFFLTLFAIPLISTVSCKGGSGGGGDLHVPGNESGSKPVSRTELAEYKRAILKCYKTGGSRIVKIKGKLMCY